MDEKYNDGERRQFSSQFHWLSQILMTSAHHVHILGQRRIFFFLSFLSSSLLLFFWYFFVYAQILKLFEDVRRVGDYGFSAQQIKWTAGVKTLWWLPNSNKISIYFLRTTTTTPKEQRDIIIVFFFFDFYAWFVWSKHFAWSLWTKRFYFIPLSHTW